jgi:flavin-dependent dehydrogenase
MCLHVEVLVAGGGPAGAAAALVLARRGRRVLVADSAGGHEPRIGEAMPPAVRPLLRDLGVLAPFLADAHRPCYGNISVWGHAEPAETDFIFDVNGHGWHLDRARFDAALRVAARNAGAEVWSATRLVGAIRDGATWRVALAPRTLGEEQIRCDWLIDATGRRAAVARRVGGIRLCDDALVAFHARFRAPAATDHDSRTAVESDPDGWWYTGLVPSGERVVAFLTDADLVDRATLLSTRGFVQRLDASRYVRGLLVAHGYEAVGAVRGADAGTARLDRVAGAGWVAVGDAAVSFDPLSSQGILTALFTGLRAGQAIDRALAGDTAGMEEYARRVDEIDRAYRRHRDACYAAEGRWLDRPFWHRRHVDSVK